MLNKIVDYVYPRVCGFCNKIISEEYTCKICQEKLKYIYESEKQLISVNKNFEILVCAYKYKGIIRSKLLQYKFKNKKYLYLSLSERLVKLLNRYSKEIDFIIPVPIHFMRSFERGYNQSMLIAQFIAQKMNIELRNNILKKVHNNKPQSILSASKRKKNVSNVYIVKNSNAIRGKTILLIDDIYTTGATVNECSRILKENGAKKIIVATIAKATISKQVAKEEIKWMN
ncbi:MAG: ComF family protein [Clostridia bacterium]|nr:ComF family protein [Clostridia bacterium]